MRRFLVLFAILLLSFGGALLAQDDFEDDSGDSSFDDGGDTEDEVSGDFSDEHGKDDNFDAEEEAKKKKKEDQKNSDDAMKDLLGGDEEESGDSAAEGDKSAEEDHATEVETPMEETSVEETPIDSEESATPAKGAFSKALKPVLSIQGGFLVFGQYKTRSMVSGQVHKSTHGMMFGSVDRGIAGLAFNGRYVLAKATMNLRTPSKLSETDASAPVVTNPWIAANYADYNANFYNWLHEVWGGANMLGAIKQKLLIRAGKMLPTYGLVDEFDSIGAGIGTMYGTRDLVSTEGYIPESDAGWALDFDLTVKKKHHILFDFMMGSGIVGDASNNSYWFSDKVMGIYLRAGYASRYIKVLGSLQSRSNQVTVGTAAAPKVKTVPFLGFGFAAKLIDIHGFNMAFSFDYATLKLVKDFALATARTTSTTNMMVHVMPWYDISIKKPWLDTLQLSFRFDLIKGGYEYGATMKNVYDFAYYTEKNMHFRIGFATNWYLKEYAGVKSFWGFSFMMQPKSELKKKIHPNTYKYNDGFTAIMLTAGAEY